MPQELQNMNQATQLYTQAEVDTIAADLQDASAFIHYDNGTSNTPLTQNIWEFFAMTGATLEVATAVEFQQLAGFPDTFEYIGTSARNVRFVSTTGLRRIGIGTNTYQMRVVKNGIQIGGVKQFELGGVDASITMTSLIDIVNGDQIWIEIRNITDNDDIRLLSANMTLK